MSWAEIARRLSKSIINLWRWRQGVQPNMHHLLAHQNLADSMGLGHLLPRVRCVIEIPEHKKVNTIHDRLLRRRDVERITGMSRASIYRLMHKGEFPRPVKVGSTAVRWKESDITAWIESRPVATSDFGSTAA